MAEQYSSQLTGAEIDAALVNAKALGDNTGLVYGTGNGSTQHKALDQSVSSTAAGIPYTAAVARAIAELKAELETQQFTYSYAAASISAGAAKQYDATNSIPAGYYCAGIISYTASASGAHAIKMVNGKNGRITVVNHSTSAATITPSMTILISRHDPS